MIDINIMFSHEEIISVINALENHRKVLLSEYDLIKDEELKIAANRILNANRRALNKAYTINDNYKRELDIE